MRVSFIITHPSHGSPGSFYRPYEMAKNLEFLGIQSKIFTPFEDDVKRIKDVSIEKLDSKDSFLNIGESMYGTFRKIIYNKKLSSFVPYDKLLLSLSNKICNSLETSITNTDIIQAEQEVASLAAIKIGKKFKIPVVADIHNIWPEELVSTGHLKKDSQSFKNLMNIEKTIMTEATHIIVVNEFMQEYIIENFSVDKSKITIVPPGGQILFDENNISDKNTISKKIIYAGLVNPREHVDLFVKSIPYIQENFPNTEYIISEQGESANDIKKLCTNLSIKPNFYWFESRDEARKLIQECFLGALPSKDDIGRKLGTPLKLLEYFSHGLPVVANDVSSWSKIIKDEKVGILTNDDPKDFADGFTYLLNDKTEYENFRKNIHSLIEKKFNWKHHTSNILIPLYQKLTQ